METRYHYVSLDSPDDLTLDTLEVSLDGTTWVVANPVSEPAGAGDLDPPDAGHTRYWWRVLVGPGQTLDPTGLGEPLVARGRLVSTPEVLSASWVLGDPTPDVLPPMAVLCWPVVIPDADRTAWDGYTTEVAELAKQAAVATLRSLVGQRVGGCPVTVRPCQAECGDRTWASFPVAGVSAASGWRPALASGVWLNIGCRHDGIRCGCSAVGAIRLLPPVGPVQAVWVHGVQLDPADYRVGGNYLYRLDGAQWPLTQDLTQPFDGPDAFAVTYLNSLPVDGLGAYVAGVLAVEYAKGLTGSKCRIPAGVTQVQRQGVTLTLADAMPGGSTGIREVDAWVRQYNPHGLRTPSTVWSPDLASAG